jgi:dipeptidyl aminopeptidase/acylaminoacyl peptidase
MEVFEVVKDRLRLLVCLTALALVALSLVGGIYGCKKTTVKDEGNNEITDGQDDIDTNIDTGTSAVAFIRNDLVYLANADGSNVRQLTSSAAGYGDLAFSPSGKKLAATKVEGDAFPQLIIIDVASGKVTDISWTNPDYSAAWTAAGVEPWFGGISFTKEDVLYCTGMKNPSDQIIVQVLKYDFSAHQITVIEGDAQNPAVNKNGNSLAYIRKPADWAQTQGGMWGTGDFGDLVIRDLASGSTRVLKGNVFVASFSPQGENMAVVYFDEPDTALQLTDLDGNRLYTLSHIGPSGSFGHPSFSPQGDYVAAHRKWRDLPEQPYTYTLFVVATSGNNPPVTDFGEGKDPAWSL